MKLANGREHERPIYYYTCRHGVEQLGTATLPLPYVTPDDSGYVWMTNLEYLIPEVMGWPKFDDTGCERTERYRALETDVDGVMWWMDARKHLGDHITFPLELREGVMPVHWFVSAVPVKVTYDPVGG